MKKWLVVFLVFFLFGGLDAKGTSAADLKLQTQLFVANSEALCAGYTNCFFNDSLDLPGSNALMKAIQFARENNLTDASIDVLSPYEINSNRIGNVSQIHHNKLVVNNTDGTVQQMVGPLTDLTVLLSNPTQTATVTPTRTPTRTSTPTRTITLTRTPTPFLTATSMFKTSLPDEPTLYLQTATETPTIEQTTESSLTPEDTPTPTLTPSRTPTPTVSGTPHSGPLGKTDRYLGEKQVPFVLGGIAVLLLITLLAIFIHKKH